MPDVNQFIAGFSAGATSTIILHPLDVVKIRYQVNNKGKNAPILETLNKIVSERGFKGLYRGLSANFTGATSSWGLYFIIYDSMKSKWLKDYSDKISAFQYFLFSASAGTITISITNPIWVVKTRLCANDDPSSPMYYRNMREALLSIYKKDGIRGFYRGFIPGLLGTSHGAIQFMIYEKMKEYYASPPDTLAYILMSASSKLMASLITYPYQVLRSRLQIALWHPTPTPSHSIAVGGGSTGMVILKLCQDIVKHEGLLGFYKGVLPNVLRVLPATCITFVTYENILAYLKQRNKR